MSGVIHIPNRWELNTIGDASAMLTELTGRDFEADMLEAAHSGELPADERDGLEGYSGGNLENARALRHLATVTLPLFAAINAVLGIPELNPDGGQYRPTWDGIRIYTLFERHRRAGLEIPVPPHAVKVNGLVETHYCLRDVVAWVRWKLPDVKTALDKLLTLEKERAELEATTPQTPSESKYKRERLAAIDREVAALEEHGHIAESPAQAVEGAAKVVATPARGKPKRGVTRKDALLPFIAEAVEEWRAEHRGGWPLAADVLRVLRVDYESGSECGVIERVTEDGIEWRPPNAAESKTAGIEALRKRLERMHKRKECNAVKVRTDAMDAMR